MERFPKELLPSNKNIIGDLYYKHCMNDLRRLVYEHMLTQDVNTYVDLSGLKYSDHPDLLSMVQSLIVELKELGWKTKLMYGQTALFVYPPETVPKFF